MLLFVSVMYLKLNYYVLDSIERKDFDEGAELRTQIILIKLCLKLYSAVYAIFLFSGEYDQNLCDSTIKNCTKCALRLPSCIGSSDGPNPFPTRLWKKDYISCFLNRTMAISKCQEPQYFNPKLSKCMDHVPKGTVF
jgi:hypothetical protein